MKDSRKNQNSCDLYPKICSKLTKLDHEITKHNFIELDQYFQLKE